MLSTFPTSIYIFILTVQYLRVEVSALKDSDFEVPLESHQVQSKLRNPRLCLNSGNTGLSMENYPVLNTDQQNTPDPNLNFLKNKLSKYLKDGKYIKKRDVSEKPRNVSSTSEKPKKAEKPAKINTKTEIVDDQIFDDWTAWSACSVTCGKGRHIRWRHCLQNCDGVETEMEEKECQFPACPNKLFGLIKL
ncbi:uncharacterized protein [Leptinotarsa decemlineata]|uniref:uncharacterized protein n=1 Tax=Leptinotarsa decemlineata TaxID=7539 RepID=UPI003D30C771